MTDRELLELAAKAAGVEISTWSNCQPGGFLKGGAGKFWNPLTDDADALRLAVNLALWGDKDFIAEIQSIITYPGDNYAATRRAIVRAAAAIGGEA